MDFDPLNPKEVDVEKEYILPAMQRVEAVVEEQSAATRLEVQSRISEGYFDESRENIQPHHVTTAIQRLVNSGAVRASHETSKAHHEIELFTPRKTARRETRIAKASQRKRALAARFQSWGTGTQRNKSGLLGPAGEAAARLAMETASTTQPMVPGFGPVRRPLNIEVPGPFDSGVFITPLTDDGLPEAAVAVPIEVKNIRGWIYPSSHELYQLLWKAGLMQQAPPKVPICPVLLCRKAHFTTFVMAKTLGFLVFVAEQQYLPVSVEETHVDEVRTELYFRDLTRSTEPNGRFVRGFQRTLPVQAPIKASKWQETCSHPELIQCFDALRSENLRHREGVMTDLRTRSIQFGVSNAGW